MNHEISTLTSRIRDVVYDQALIQGENTRQKLCACSYKAVLQAMVKFKNDNSFRGEELCASFGSLLELKKRHENLQRLSRSLKAPPVRLTAKDLLEMMFKRVASVMASEDELLPGVEMEAGSVVDYESTIEIDDSTLNYTHTVYLD